MKPGSGKILERDVLAEKIRVMKAGSKRVGFTNGCFDILHLGHVRYLAKAKTECDILVVGLNSDLSVRELKGPERPVNSEGARAEVLSALSCVDFVTIFSELTPIELIKKIMPDVLFKGGDWKEADIVGAPEVKKNGGRVVVVPYE
ncbi:MAG TPA: adenylyltransferase/cytidyltransferase family protein, partial [Candidatus Omnitrophota bacterium]|nr:adenylyltransferase/cytidyltransferase family protein [Candidatus Omnitrophota bacterium]